MMLASQLIQKGQSGTWPVPFFQNRLYKYDHQILAILALAPCSIWGVSIIMFIQKVHELLCVKNSKFITQIFQGLLTKMWQENKYECHMTIHRISLCRFLNLLYYYYLVQFFSWTEKLDCFKDKLSITTVIFIRSENNLVLLQFCVLLGISEHMLWIQSMLRDTCGIRGLTIGWNCLD